MAETAKKPISQLQFPADLRYHPEHAWAKAEDGTLVVGISDYAQDQLGDVIFVELPAIGEHFAQGAPFGVVESAKSVSTLYLPIAGEILAINEELENDPETINHDPYGAGWMIRIQPDAMVTPDGLLSAGEYQSLLEEKAHA